MVNLGLGLPEWSMLQRGHGQLHMSAVGPVKGDDEAVPPVSVCVRCGLAVCGGCVPASGQARPSLAWEDSPSNWLFGLWQTALSSSTEPELVFGQLRAGPVSPALAFAFLAEALALGSLVLLGSALLWLLAPDLAAQLLYHPGAVAAGLVLLAGSVLLMLVLHVLWGICLDIGGGLGHGRVDIRLGARFGLYACGWDLMTSPLGLFWSLLASGPRRGLAAVGAAARAARPAQRAYLEVCRGYDADARRRAVRLAVVVVGIVILSTGAGLLAAMLWLARQLGY
jgi:hypothetical protein